MTRKRQPPSSTVRSLSLQHCTWRFQCVHFGPKRYRSSSEPSLTAMRLERGPYGRNSITIRWCSPEIWKQQGRGFASTPGVTNVSVLWLLPMQCGLSLLAFTSKRRSSRKFGFSLPKTTCARLVPLRTLLPSSTYKDLNLIGLACVGMLIFGAMAIPGDRCLFAVPAGSASTML